MDKPRDKRASAGRLRTLLLPSKSQTGPRCAGLVVLSLLLAGLALGLALSSGATAERAEGVGAALGGAQITPGLGDYGQGSTSLFGLTGEGFKFVYVFDRSGSMGGSGQTALAAAKAELINSLESLGKVQQFQIIFYNETPVIFNPAGRPGKLAFATDSNKEHAKRFIGSITAVGGTAHEEALKMALRLRPDVIFFLTDAGDPQLEPKQLEKIRAWAVGITINVVEFGLGPKPAGDNFLMRLARENAGQYTYVDTSTFASADKQDP